MKTKIFIIVLILIIVVGATAVILKITNENQEGIKVFSQEELREAYRDQNLYFGSIVNIGYGEEEFEKDHGYRPISLSHPNIDGIAIDVYADLVLYRKETGSSLTYDQVIEYLSQEFEDDGEIRIFINGRHPEIAAYIEWANADKYRNASSDYSKKLKDIYVSYADEHEVFPRCVGYFLPIDMFDELIKKEADPDYQMNLKTIQDRYIAEGKAKVSEDGKTIEYIVPEK